MDDFHFSATLFWLGCAGSAAVEIANGCRACANLDGRVPVRYTRWPYLMSRLLLALAGGTLAVVFEAPTSLAAFYLGASAPLVIDKLAQGAIPSPPAEAAPNQISN